MDYCQLLSFGSSDFCYQKKTIRHKIWSEASATCSNSSGAEYGVDFRVAAKHLTELVQSERFGDHDLLLRALRDGLWTQQRRFDKGLSDSPLCPRCQVENEDLHHRLWDCPCNPDSLPGHDLVFAANAARRHNE